MNNPFRYGEIVTGDDFADRENELSALISDLQSQARIFLVSPRRYGKSSLLVNALDRVREKGFLTAYIDLYRTPSLKAYVELYASLIAAAGRSKVEEIVKLLKEFLPALRPKISLDTPEGASISFDVAFAHTDVQKHLRDVYDLPERIAKRKKKHFIVVIDEFQEIANLGGTAMEKEMRAAIQTHSHVSYVFAGSKRELILDMVQQQTRAFYQIGKIMMLEKIPRDCFASFLHNKFIESKYRVPAETISYLLDLVEDFPHNAQFMCHELWELHRDTRKITRSDVEDALRKILENNAPIYISVWDALSLIQRRVLAALAKERTEGLFSRERVQHYDLGSAASAQTAVRGLHKKGIVERANGGYFFTDVFFKHWIEANIRI